MAYIPVWIFVVVVTAVLAVRLFVEVHLFMASVRLLALLIVNALVLL
jgi:hypothetical protein